MRIDVATLFPEMCEAVLSESILGRARKKRRTDRTVLEHSDYTLDKHRRVDDVPMAEAAAWSCSRSDLPLL